MPLIHRAAKETQVKVPMTVSIGESAYRAIVSMDRSEAPDAQKLQKVSTGLLQDLSEGGLMLDAETMDRIRQSLADADDPMNIVEAIEKGAKTRAGAIVGEWVLDPSWVDPITAIASIQGKTVEEVVQNMMDMALSNGWFYEFEVGPKGLFFDKHAMDRLEVIAERQFNSGEELVRWICDRTGIPFEVPPEDSDLLAGLLEPLEPAAVKD
jgi:hypothetical protein